MGCPVGKVIRSGDGSALMRDPELAGRVIEAVVKAVDVPVTVKFRKGWDGGNVNAVAFAQMCQQAGAAASPCMGARACRCMPAAPIGTSSATSSAP